MKRFEIRQNRINELTRRALRGQTLAQLISRCVEWDVSPGTQRSYIEEVRERIEKARVKQGVSDK